MTTSDDIIDIIKIELMGIATKFEDDNFTYAMDDALRETGWSLPTSDAFKIFWIKKRAKRHLFFAMLTDSAHKFKFEQINLQHRFDHYQKLVEAEDREWELIQESEPYRFAGVSATQMFGHKIDAGFAYNDVGEDITHEDENLVNVTPGDAD